MLMRRGSSIFIIVCCLFFVSLGIDNVKAQPSLQQTKVKVNSLVKNGCYAWKDKDVSTQDNGIPLPPAFYGMEAEKVNCLELHHFQIISVESQRNYLKAKSAAESSKKYCEQKLRKSKLNLFENTELNWRWVETFKSDLYFSCIVRGKVSIKPGSVKAYFYEELFFPLGIKK